MALIAFIIITSIAPVLGSLFPPDEWYRAIEKPSFTPPDWVFGPVWTLLYLMMAIAAWLVWRHPGPGVAIAIFAWCVQLALNAAWSWLFFGLHRPDLAFFNIVLQWLAIAVTIALFWRVTPVAAGLMLPYLAWVSFAAVLSGAIWRLNPSGGPTQP